MKVFITGASGFVGGAIAGKLVKDFEVLAMARSGRAARKVEALGVISVKCDLKTVRTIHLQDSELLIHSAGFVESWGTREQFWEGNVEGTRRILEIARAANVKRFIFIGTEAAFFYGQDMIDIDETYPYPDETPFLYSESKAEAEKLVLAANEPGVFETVSIRPRFVWGPNDQTILPNLIAMIKAGNFMWVNEGEFRAATTYIGNLVYAVKLAIEKGKGGEAYFVTDGETWTVRKFISALLETQEMVGSRRSVPVWLVRFVANSFEYFWKLFNLKSKPPITRFSAGIMSTECTIRIDKAKRELGYEPLISIPQGMKILEMATLKKKIIQE